MFRRSDVSRWLFRRHTRPSTPPPSNRVRPNLTLLEDRTVPSAVVTITATAPNVGEGSSASFQVSRSDTTGTLSVNFSLTGTATNGSDYNGSTSSPVFFPSGMATVGIFVLTTNDGTSEPTETVIATLAAGTGYTVGSPDSATINILDNDAQAVSVERVNDGVEDGTDGVFRFTRIGSLSGSLMVSYSVGGTATSGTDYTALSGTVNFAASSATADVNVAALRDNVVDEDETVTVTVTSGMGYSVGSPSSAQLTVIDVADLLPIAFDGSTTTPVNEAVVVEVLDFATDLDDDPLTVIGVTQGEDGSVVLNLDGTATYTPDTDFVGEDSFTYTVEDQFGNESTGTITVTVTAPIATPTSVWTAQNTPVTIEVLDLAFDPDEDELEVTAVTQGTSGSVVVNLDGTVTYTPNSSFAGDDSFTYTVEDPDGNEATHTITVTVGDTDPIALDDTATTPVNTAVHVAVLELSFDPAGDTLSVISVTQGTNGTVVINPDGTVTYTPNASFEGTDTFTYTVEDEDENPATGTITVTVGVAPPTAADEIEDDLSDMQDEIENYDEDTPATLLAAVTGITDGIEDYLADVTSFISTNNIGTSGAGQPFKEFMTDWFRVYKYRLYSDYLNLLNMEALLWNILVANKQLMDSIAAERKAEINKPQPNGARIKQLTQAYVNLGKVHVPLQVLWVKLDNQIQNKSSMEALKTWKALVAGYPPMVQRLFAPPLPPQREIADILLK